MSELEPLKRITKKMLAKFGYQVTRTNTIRYTFKRALEQLRDAGFSPRTIVDVGVAYGTPDLYQTFPDARLMLVEALEEWEPVLKKLQAERGADYVVAAAGPEPGVTTITVPTVLSWASVLPHVRDNQLPTTLDWQATAGGSGDVVTREVPVVTLDSLLETRGLQPPYMLKIDVEGAEGFVLAGAEKLLELCDVVACEVTPDANYWDIHNSMQKHGFMLHDVYDQQYRPSDSALIQFDMLFVKADGPLRNKPYCLPGQDHIDSMAKSLYDSHRETLRDSDE